MNRPGRRDSGREHDTDGAGFDHKREGLIIINALSLGKSTNNPPRFVSGKGPVRVIFNMKNPLTTNNMSVGWGRTSDHVSF